MPTLRGFSWRPQFWRFLSLFMELRRYMGWGGSALVVLAVTGLCYHAWKLYPYSELITPQAILAEGCTDDGAIKVMIANVQERNEQAVEFLALVARVDPDILLVMETNEWWDGHLASLTETFSAALQHIPDDRDD